jgi:hypothetical protein
VVVCAAIGYLANLVWHTNFWFLNLGAPGSPLEGIQMLAGNLYVPVLIVLLAILWTVMYLPWVLRAPRSEEYPSYVSRSSLRRPGPFKMEGSFLRNTSASGSDRADSGGCGRWIGRCRAARWAVAGGGYRRGNGQGGAGQRRGTSS